MPTNNTTHRPPPLRFRQCLSVCLSFVLLLFRRIVHGYLHNLNHHVREWVWVNRFSRTPHFIQSTPSSNQRSMTMGVAYGLSVLVNRCLTSFPRSTNTAAKWLGKINSVLCSAWENPNHERKFEIEKKSFILLQHCINCRRVALEVLGRIRLRCEEK